MTHTRIAGLAHGNELARVVRQTVQIHTYATRIRAIARHAADAITVPSNACGTSSVATKTSTPMTPTAEISAAGTTVDAVRRTAAFAAAPTQTRDSFPPVTLARPTGAGAHELRRTVARPSHDDGWRV